MSSLARPVRLSAAASSRSLRHKLLSRGFRSSTRDHAASNYLMPAMSPTMSEGNIATWKVKEGESFNAGDVLLEIETDKAQMDVEAQEDGILAKIMQGDGAKNVQVGARIAVMAEEGDDLASLELPPDEQPASATKSQESSKSEATPDTKAANDEQQRTVDSKDEALPSDSHKPTAGHAQEQSYPLYPSVVHLLHTNNIPLSDASKIPATGPAGRLLKGDVLAYLNAIPRDYAADLSARLEKLSHLDLSNIKRITPSKPASTPAPETATPKEPVEEPTQIAVPISLTAVLATQKRIRAALGLDLPLSTFIARASELANESLPRPRAPPSSDELFDAVLGLDHTAVRTSRGHYYPQITAVGPSPISAEFSTRSKAAGDIFDELTTPAPRRSTPRSRPAVEGVLDTSGTGTNVFSVAAARGEEARARTYLERVKTALERETARLVL